MSFLDRFRRNKQESVLPEEVKEYYQSERRQKRGVAVGLALVALVATVAVAAALFFGGRFAYNQIWGNDDKQDSGTSQNEGQDWSGGQNEQGESGGTQQQPQNQPGGEGGQPTSPAPDSQPEPAPQPAPSTPPTPSLGDEPMPHTGDPGM